MPMKTIDMDELAAFKEEKDRTGIVYISRIPPLMGPQELRSFLCPFGEISRVYLTPVDKTGTKRRGLFIDGWVEFKNKKAAKNAALALNGTTVAGKRTGKYYGELWSIKYLAKFKWHQLTEQLEYEKATRQQKMMMEISQAKREASFYLKQAEKAETNAKIEAKRAAKWAAEGQAVDGEQDRKRMLEGLKKRFRQRKPIINK